MFKWIVIYSLAIAVLLFFPEPLYTKAQIDPASLPLLPEPRHIGSMFYGWGAPPASEVQPRIDDATAAGMNAFTVYLDWTELEPEQGHYHLDELQATLEWASENGLSTFANITVIDIENLAIPAEFMASSQSGGAELAEGMRLNNPDLLERFLLLLDQAVPLMVDNGVFYLGVGNEVDAWLHTHPNAFNDYLEFIATVKAHVQKIEPRLAVGLTVTGDVPLYNQDMFKAFYSVADVVSANIYAIDVSDFTVMDQAEIITLFEDFVASFDGRTIVIPEFGCNSSSLMNSSPDIQGTCYETMLTVFARHENIRFATAFTFHDFQPELCQMIQEAFGYDGQADFATIYDKRIAEYLCSLGLVQPDGTAKPAFAVFLRGVSEITGH